MLHCGSNNWTTEFIVLIRCRWGSGGSVISEPGVSRVQTHKRMTSRIALMPLFSYVGTPWLATDACIHATTVLLVSHDEWRVCHSMWQRVGHKKPLYNEKTRKNAPVSTNCAIAACCYRHPWALAEVENRQPILLDNVGTVCKAQGGLPDNKTTATTI